MKEKLAGLMKNIFIAYEAVKKLMEEAKYDSLNSDMKFEFWLSNDNKIFKLTYQSPIFLLQGCYPAKDETEQKDDRKEEKQNSKKVITKSSLIFRQSIYNDVPTMCQSFYENPNVYNLASDVDKLITGVMGCCVSVAALGEPQNGKYKKMCGQHGAGGIASINFKKIMSTAGIQDDVKTKFIVVFPPTSGTPKEVLNTLRSYSSQCFGFIELSQFEFYESSNAIVTREGIVYDNNTGNELKKIVTFIAKYRNFLFEKG